MRNLYRMTDGDTLYIVHGPNGEEEVVRGVLVKELTPLYAVCGRCGGHAETWTDGLTAACSNCADGYVAFNNAAREDMETSDAAVKGET